VTVGDDGYVRLWDYINMEEFYSRNFTGKATCVEWVPFNRKNNGRCVVAGYNSGICRWLMLN